PLPFVCSACRAKSAATKRAETSKPEASKPKMAAPAPSLDFADSEAGMPPSSKESEPVSLRDVELVSSRSPEQLKKTADERRARDLKSVFDVGPKNEPTPKAPPAAKIEAKPPAPVRAAPIPPRPIAKPAPPIKAPVKPIAAP